jgi:ATP-binding cassette subfamily F protein 1
MGKKGRRRGDDSDDDPLADNLKHLALKAEKEKGGDDADAANAGEVKMSRADKRKEKQAKKKGGKGGGKDADDSDDEDPLARMERLNREAEAAEAKQEESSEEDIPQPVKKGKAGKNKKAMAVEDVDIDVESDDDDDDDEEPIPQPVARGKGKMSKAERKKAKRGVLPDPAVEAEEERLAAEKAKAAAEAKSKKPKSKLELKLEQARIEKEARDAAIAAEEEARLNAEAEEKKKKKEKKKAKKAAAEAALAEDEDKHEEGEEDADGSVKNPADDETEQEKEARMMATMYGDDVHTEWGNASSGAQGAGDEDEEDEDGGKKKKKVSRKKLRQQQQEVEAKEREEEYNKAMLKASQEGAQFAVSQTIVDPNDPNWQNALDIVIPSISISAHSKELLVNTELVIAHGRRYGLVGPNGAGKSTLLKMISSGELKVPPKVDYLYVEQEVMADETAAVDAVLKADKERWDLVQEEKQLLEDLKKGSNEKLDVRLGEVYEALAACGAASAESKARRILFGLGFDAEMQVRPTKYFSGGWRMRISLARALFIEPTLLMLDEPTNHLDLNAVIWLDDYLQRWKKTLLIVSHDQDFLNSVCEEILHLEDRKLVTYKGNYDSFKEQETVRRKQLMKAWEKQERKLRELKRSGVSKANAEKEQMKAAKGKREPGARSKKSKNDAGGMAESNEQHVELIQRPRDYQVVFKFPEVTEISPPILEVRDCNFRYGPNLPLLFKDVNFGLDMDSRVCIVGPNGSGKSTLLKLITGEVSPPEGEVRRNPRLRIGVYNQHFVDRLPMEEDPVTYLRRLFNEESYQSVRNMLGRYGLEGHAHTIPMRDLSGGQKARVVFVELSLLAPHLLFLDEPTNNLDIESIDALCDALQEYNGGVVLVSHDARLIETVECQLWVVEDHNVYPWEEGFQNYRQHLLKQLEDQLSAIIAGGGERPGESK